MISADGVWLSVGRWSSAMMKHGCTASFTAVDWSEFHVWSPNAVYKELNRDHCFPSVAFRLRVWRGSRRLERGANGTEGRVRIVREEAKDAGDHRHPGLVREAYVQFSAGALGGSTATYVTHWLDTIKVKMQTKPGQYSSGYKCFRQTTSADGVIALYQGAVPAVVGQTCKTAVVFMSYGLCEELVRRLTGCSKTHDLTVWHHAAAGAMTGIVASFILCPLELLKCRLQAMKQVTDHLKSSQEQNLLRSMTSIDMVKYILRREGFSGLYRGLPGIWVKEVPGSFIYFGSYEAAKYTMRRLAEKEHLGRRAVFICGMFAGMCFCVTHPIESVKTRVQVMSAVSSTQGFLRMFAHILKTEGIKPLMCGIGPSMVRACLYSGIQFVTYESVKEMFLCDY